MARNMQQLQSQPSATLRSQPSATLRSQPAANITLLRSRSHMALHSPSLMSGYMDDDYGPIAQFVCIMKTHNNYVYGEIILDIMLTCSSTALAVSGTETPM